MPSEDDEVIEVMPAMVENCRSIGEATEAAMVSGLAPGRVAVISMVGKSTARQRGDRQQPVGEDAEHDERRRDQRRHHRAADAGFGETHVRSPPWRRFARATLRPVGQQQMAVGDDGLAAFQARLAMTDSHVDRVRSTLTGCNGGDAVLHHEHDRPRSG